MEKINGTDFIQGNSMISEIHKSISRQQYS